MYYVFFRKFSCLFLVIRDAALCWFGLRLMVVVVSLFFFSFFLIFAFGFSLASRFLLMVVVASVVYFVGIWRFFRFLLPVSGTNRRGNVVGVFSEMEQVVEDQLAANQPAHLWIPNPTPEKDLVLVDSLWTVISCYEFGISLLENYSRQLFEGKVFLYYCYRQF